MDPSTSDCELRSRAPQTAIKNVKTKGGKRKKKKAFSALNGKDKTCIKGGEQAGLEITLKCFSTPSRGKDIRSKKELGDEVNS